LKAPNQYNSVIRVRHQPF